MATEDRVSVRRIWTSDVSVYIRVVAFICLLYYKLVGARTW